MATIQPQNRLSYFNEPYSGVFNDVGYQGQPGGIGSFGASQNRLSGFRNVPSSPGGSLPSGTFGNIPSGPGAPAPDVGPSTAMGQALGTGLIGTIGNAVGVPGMGGIIGGAMGSPASDSGIADALGLSPTGASIGLGLTSALGSTLGFGPLGGLALAAMAAMGLGIAEGGPAKGASVPTTIGPLSDMTAPEAHMALAMPTGTGQIGSSTGNYGGLAQAPATLSAPPTTSNPAPEMGFTSSPNIGGISAPGGIGGIGTGVGLGAGMGGAGAGPAGIGGGIGGGSGIGAAPGGIGPGW